MSLAENLLNSLDETTYENMRIAGSGEEEHIIVGQDRSITVPNALKTIAVKGDKDVETATIDCVRYWDGNDLSTFAIYLNYILPNGDEGTYIPKSITKSVDFFTFDWQIGSEFTYSQGKLTFWIVAKLTDNSGTLVRQWSSFQNSDCTIAQGGDKIYVPEKQTDQDVISQAISISRASAETAEQQANLAKEAAEKAATDAREAAEDEVSRIIGELGVVQELGDSPNSVVSQLKVTKEFNKTNAKINRNSKRITNLEQGLPAEMFETDSTMAYQKDVPENVLPYASINKIGGMTYKSNNLIQNTMKTQTASGVTFTVNSDGSITLSGTATSDFTKVIALTSHIPVGDYYLSGSVSGASIVIDATESNGKYIKGVKWGNGEATIDYDGYSYVQVYLYIYSGKTFSNVTVYPMLNEGSTALPYEPYYEGLRDTKVTEVKSVGVNLFDKKTIEINQGLGKDGNPYNTQGKCYSDAIAVQEGSIYSISNIDWYNFYYNAEKPSNNNFILQSATTLVTVPNGAKYIRLSMEMEKIDIAMLNRGANALPYTPYVEHILPIPEAVQALDGWGQGIPGTECCNFLDWRPEDGVRAWHHVKDRHIFDGSEVWEKGIVDYVFLSDTRILPSIPKSQGDVGNTHNYEVELSNNNIVVKTTMTADEFAAELATLYEAGTPFIVDYERESPEVTDISDLLTADNLISVEGGGTLTFENEYGYAVPSEVEYQVEV